MIANIIAILIVALAVGAAVRYIVKAKKKGVKCIGCSAAGSCPSAKNGHAKCSCGCQDKK